MLYKLVGVVERKVYETIKLEVEASNPEDAQDLAYEVLSEYPNSNLVVNRLLRVNIIGERPTGVALEFQRDEAEQVFEGNNDDDDGDDDPPPRYA